MLDEVHAQNWRDIYRGPSSDMPSMFDELDQQQQMQQQQQQRQQELHNPSSPGAQNQNGDEEVIRYCDPAGIQSINLNNRIG